MLDASHLAKLLLAPSTQLLLAAGPAPARLTIGCRVRVWTGALGTFRGWTRDGWCVVAIDGERAISGGVRTDAWQRWQVEAVES